MWDKSRECLSFFVRPLLFFCPTSYGISFFHGVKTIVGGITFKH